MTHPSRRQRGRHRFIARWPAAILLFLLLINFSGPGYADPDPKTLFEQAVRKFKEEKYQESVDLFTELILITPDNARAYKNRGVALMNLNKLDFAIRDFEKAVDLDPRLTGVHINMGALWHYWGDDEKAISFYDKAISQNPDSYVAYFNRSLSRISLQRYDAAAADLDEVLKRKPGFREALTLKQEIQDQITKPHPVCVYTVQTGAFLFKNNAIEMVTQLKNKGVDAHIVTLQGARHRNWFLVRCGKDLPFKSAEKLRRVIKEKTHVQAVVRPMNRF